MTAQTLKKQSGHKISQGDSCRVNEDHATLAKQMKLFSIAKKMKKAGLTDSFIVNAVRVSLEFDGIADLMSLWAEEVEQKEKEEIIADIQDMIEASEIKDIQEEMYIKFNDLDAISKNIRAFKDSLYQEVMKQGGVSRLAELTDIPQPSLSRFFNSNAMPRRSTVLAIAKALNLDGLAIDMKWSK